MFIFMWSNVMLLRLPVEGAKMSITDMTASMATTWTKASYTTELFVYRLIFSRAPWTGALNRKCNADSQV